MRTSSSVRKPNLVIGVLTDASPSADGRSFGSQSRTLLELTGEAERQGASLFVFRTSEIIWSHRNVWGFVFQHGRWRRKRLPLPDVIYNRLRGRAVERKQTVRAALRRLRASAIPIFNHAFLNKAQTFASLKADPALEPYLLKTARLRSPGQLVEWVEATGHAFCKPTHGSLGNGICEVWRAPKGGVRYRFNMSPKQMKAGRFARLSHLRQLGRALLRRGPYLIQDAAELPTLNGRRWDIRTLVQRDAHGEWQLTGAAGRVAARGAATTHVPRGGSRANLETLIFNSDFHLRPELDDVMANLTHVSTLAARAVAAHHPGHWGEFSLDIGLDKNGKLWIFEMNAKPFRFDEPDIQARRQAGVIACARYLAHGAPPQEEIP